MFCGYCGAQIPGDAFFCGACGKAIAAPRNPPQASQSLQEAPRPSQASQSQQAPHPSQASQSLQAASPPQASQADGGAELWDRLTLPIVITQQLQNACQMLREAARNQTPGASLSNILLFGPAGTRKAEIARTFANAAGVAFLPVGGAALMSQFVGQSGGRVREVFTRARAVAPSVLFIDEIETVAPKRNSLKAGPSTGEIVIQMLIEMDGAKKEQKPIFVLAATNLIDEIDVAILSRFPVRIEIPLRGESAR